MTRRAILVTGFEPFGGDTLNPSAEVARALDGQRIDGVPVHGLVLPCTFAGALPALQAALAARRPQLVLALGLAAGREGFTPERVALNLIDARIADNAGAQPLDEPVVPAGPAAYFTTLPIKAMVAALRAAGWPASVSLSAGSFVCNQVFYGLQHACRRRRGTRSGFMHLPCLPEQAAAAPCPSLPLAAMVQGVQRALAVALATRDDDSSFSDGRLA